MKMKERLRAARGSSRAAPEISEFSAGCALLLELPRSDRQAFTALACLARTKARTTVGAEAVPAGGPGGMP